MRDPNFRLSKHVVPSRYDLRIEADLDAWRFKGFERIDLTVTRPAAEIVVHAVELEISSAEVTAAGKTLRAAVSYDADADTALLRFPEPVPAGTARLDIAFSGVILARLRGFYRSEKGGARYAATQFEAADARRAFPCFDEPEFKARFALTLVIPAGLMAVSNGVQDTVRTLPDGRSEIRFAETPPISSYLVAYCIGPFEATSPESTPSGVPVRVVLPQGLLDKGLYARQAHVRSLAYLEDYTAIPYPYTKVDAIGLADFEAGAMENPGAITYRLTAIAADAERASTHALKGIFYTAAHELTHMWWGDLVTMAWWNDLWLNESFATFVGYKVVADLMPEWGMWRDFVATLARPFALDALQSTHPISFEVKNAKQATERFDVITYWKGAGVVRMIEGFLGAAAFRRGVHSYLERYREGNATADDFWRELGAASGRDVATIANAWIKEPGHPVVHTSARSADGGLRVRLRQQRFFADPVTSATAAPERWPVPLVIKFGTATGTAEERVLLSEAEAEVTLPGAHWYFPNGGAAGFYRFTLDEASLSTLLETAQMSLGPHERLALVDNQWTLLKAGAVGVPQFLAVVEGYREETDRAVVSALAEHLGWLNIHAVGETARTEFERFVEAYFASQFAALGWDPQPAEASDERLRRAAVISALGGIARSETVRHQARQRLERYLEDRSSLDANLASAVATIAARDGDAALYERYLDRKRTATTDPEEEQRFLVALTAFETPELIAHTLDLAMSSEVRTQDRTFLLAGLLGRRASRAAAWTFVRDHWEELCALLDPMMMQGLIRALAQVTPQPLATQVLAFLPPRATDQTRETIAQATEQLAIDATACSRLERALTAALKPHR